MANFNNSLIQSGFLGKHFWVAENLSLGNIALGENYHYPTYFEYALRPKNTEAFVNVDTDASGYVFYDNMSEAPFLTEAHFHKLSKFLIRAAREDRVRPSTFHASTTYDDGPSMGLGAASGYGHAALTRFLARLAPLCISGRLHALNFVRIHPAMKEKIQKKRRPMSVFTASG